MIPIGIDEGQSRIPWATLALTAANLAVYMLVATRADFEAVTLAWGFTPDYGCLATLGAHMFLHADGFHLMLNLIFFVAPAMKVEDALGPWRFLALYLASGVAANGLHVLLAGSLPIPLIGASGAIAGVVGAFMVLYPGCRMVFWVLPPFPFTIRLPAWFFLGFWFLRELAAGYILRVTPLESPIAVWAHVGGFAYGALTMVFVVGWSRGAALEADRGKPRGARMARSHRPVGRLAGGLLHAAVAMYAIAVFLEGGLVNPARPTSAQAMAEAIARQMAGRQSVDDLFEEARRRGDGETGSVEDRLRLAQARAMAEDQVLLHTALTKGWAAAPDGMSGNLQRFLAEELPQFPERRRIEVEEVSPLSAIYVSGETYQVFCGSALSPHRVFRAYLEALNDRGWAVFQPIFDKSLQTGLIESSDGEWELAVLVAPRRVSPTHPVFVVWSLRRLRYDQAAGDRASDVACVVASDGVSPEPNGRMKIRMIEFILFN